MEHINGSGGGLNGLTLNPKELHDIQSTMKSAMLAYLCLEPASSKGNAPYSPTLIVIDLYQPPKNISCPSFQEAKKK